MGTGSVATALALLLAASPFLITTVHGQTASGLRGGVSEDETVRLLNRRPLSASRSDLQPEQPRDTKPYAPIPRYQPENEGAVSDAELASGMPATDNPDNPNGATDLFQMNRRPQAPRLPIGAAERSRSDASTTSMPASAETAAARANAEATDDTTTGTTRMSAEPLSDEERNTAVQTENSRTGAIEAAGRDPETDPYAPLGLRLGTFTVTPTLETGITMTDNADSAPVKLQGLVSESTLRLKAVSDWPIHEATLESYATWQKSLSGPDKNDPGFGINGTLRLDLAGDHVIKAAAGYELSREAAESPVPLPAAASRPLRHNLTGSLGLEKTDGKLRYALTGSVERDSYGDASLTSGGTLSQADRNFTLLTATLRAGYEISPALVPFAELSAGRRIYDNTTDSSGYARSATRLALRAGLALDTGDKLKGEVAAGWLTEDIDDSRLAAISGFTIDGKAEWSPVRGTTVSLNGSTTVEGTTTAGKSGSVLYAGSVAVSRELLANLTGEVMAGASLRSYAASSDHDTAFYGQLGFNWWLNRNLALVGRARHERQESTLPGRDYNTNSVYLGLKLQR